MKYQSILALIAAVRNGEIVEKDIEIFTDNDTTGVYVDDEKVFEGNGHYDQNDLWQELLPQATVESV